MGVNYVRNLWINTELLPDSPHGLWEWIISGTCGLTQSCFLTNHGLVGVDYFRNLWINTELLPDSPHGLWE
ncbi:hypothetical protein RRG08_020120 [Elysia crispata]|uniref:Uncharacterized protein n=1 Tax=Elysia crispata TaxID=231223 RepID=A0AAE1A667_9GAST|nr:hypothetical protein RRG08_020120 [Elysia crispata]